MKLKSIKYTNYRCFKNVSINFDTTRDKNIFMVVAPNGGGKTEMLFSFQWVLYGFDFSRLRAKESTAYSLNSTLYQNLLSSKAGDSRSCSVELSFEVDGRTYNIKRTETFKKKFKSEGIWSEENVEFSYTNEKGVKSSAKTDPEEVRELLSRIIPQNILQGIIFDGERMKQLSQINDESKQAVEGVIKQITNEDLFSRCRTELTSLQKETSRAIKQVSKKTGDTTVTDLETKISDETAEINNKTDRLKIHKLQLEQVNERLNEIHNALAEIAESKKHEDKRSSLKKELSEKEDELSTFFEDLYEDLDDGYLLICDSLFDDVDKLLSDYDIPAGLTVSAVKNILLRDKCICGHEFTPESRALLTELISKLPPDNINSAIGEMVRNARLEKKQLSNTLQRSYKHIKETEKAINSLKEQISNISVLISESASDKIKELEKENTEKTKEQALLEQNIKNLESDIAVLSKDLIKLKKERDEGSKVNGMLSKLSQRAQYIDKCLKALDAIDEYNKMVSLQDINTRINDAYEMLSEDFENGRRLYIVQYDKNSKYRLASYLEDKYNKEYSRSSQDNGYTALSAIGMSPEEIQERAIMKVMESNSTGQAKINSLAFAKAILDYSRAKRDEESTEISRSYPFMIDSPFTELSDGNLEKSAQSIHSFAEQVILMISKESLDGVKQYVEPYVGASVEIMKSKNDSTSIIKE